MKLKEIIPQNYLESDFGSIIGKLCDKIDEKLQLKQCKIIDNDYKVVQETSDLNLFSILDFQKVSNENLRLRTELAEMKVKFLEEFQERLKAEGKLLKYTSKANPADFKVSNDTQYHILMNRIFQMPQSDLIKMMDRWDSEIELPRKFERSILFGINELDLTQHAKVFLENISENIFFSENQKERTKIICFNSDNQLITIDILHVSPSKFPIYTNSDEFCQKVAISKNISYKSEGSSFWDYKQ